MSDPENDRARHTVVRALDSIPVPPGPGHLTAVAPSRTRFPLFATVGVAAALVVALAIALGAARNNAVTASAPPSTVGSVAPSAVAPSSSLAPTASPSASPSPSGAAAILDDRFGFLIWGNSVTVRSETEPSALTSFAAGGRSWTSLSRFVSPDGRSVAYWDPAGPGAVLKVRPAIGGSPRTVLTAQPGMSGNAFAWSSDSTGLVVAVDNDCEEICAAQGGTPVQELWTVDLTSGATERVASGKFWIPVIWDRTRGLVAAGVTGPGGYLVGYDLIDLTRQPHTVRSTEFRPTVLGRLAASSDARNVLLTYNVPSGGGAAITNALAWWPLAQPDARQEVSFDGDGAVWRPGTTEIWWVGGLTPAGCRVAPCSGTQLVSFDVASGVRRSLPGTFGANLLAFRVDGSAAIADVDNHGAVIVADVKTGRTERVATAAQVVATVRIR